MNELTSPRETGNTSPGNVVSSSGDIGASTRARPSALLVYAEELNRGFLTARRLRRLEQICDVVSPDPVARFDDARVESALERVEILITSWGCPPIDEAILARMPALVGIFHAAGTVKGHVTKACFERGLRVTSAAGANAIPVADYTIATILLANKRAFRIQRRYRENRRFELWHREFPGLGNAGKTIGIVGASRVGRLVLDRLRPLGFELLVHDPYLDVAEAHALGAEPCDLDDLLGRADVVSLHAPALPETFQMIDRRRLALLRNGTIFVNTARGALVDTRALTDELVSGRIDAVLDTMDPEILPPDSPLYDLDNVFLTPHIAGSLGAETHRMLDDTIDEIERFVRGEALRSEVRAEDWARIA